MAFGRGFEIIKEEFTKAGLEVPIIEEEFGSVRVLIKREIFNAIQNGGIIDDRTGKIVNAYNGKDVRTIKRAMRTLQELGLVKHVGPANGGYWIRIK